MIAGGAIHPKMAVRRMNTRHNLGAGVFYSAKGRCLTIICNCCQSIPDRNTDSFQLTFARVEFI